MLISTAYVQIITNNGLVTAHNIPPMQPVLPSITSRHPRRHVPPPPPPSLSSFTLTITLRHAAQGLPHAVVVSSLGLPGQPQPRLEFTSAEAPEVTAARAARTFHTNVAPEVRGAWGLRGDSSS